VEEFRVGLFAQELGTAERVSPVKLDRELAALRRSASSPGPAAEDASRSKSRFLPAPIATPSAAGPLKNLGALDRLFPRV
jgi:ATP-dependent helicase HrpA